MARKALFIALLLVSLARFSAAQDYEAEARFRMPFGKGALTVTEVYDGDSLKLSDGRKVRLIGVTKPEGEDGVAAAEMLAARVLGKEVRSELDPAHTPTRHHDERGRFLAYIYMDDILINEEMIAFGYALVNSKLPFRFRERFESLRKEAEREGRGIWAK